MRRYDVRQQVERLEPRTLRVVLRTRDLIGCSVDDGKNELRLNFREFRLYARHPKVSLAGRL